MNVKKIFNITISGDTDSVTGDMDLKIIVKICLYNLSELFNGVIYGQQYN